jgi:2-amino-4-hydroxy-6-hydroxymethyldihydropteridine diphosphokinase
VAHRVRAYIGLGANVGDAKQTLTAAVAALAALPDARLRGVSRLYRTKPVGVTDQPDFLNAVVALEVPGGPDPEVGAIALLAALKGIERSFGRQQRGRWGPRELDLDLLVFGPARIAVKRPPEGRPASAAIDPGAAARLLEVPHPSIGERLFVLAPLADLAVHLVPVGWRETIGTARRRREAAEGRDAVIPIGTWSARERTWLGPSGRPIRVVRAGPADADEMARVHTASSDAAYRQHRPADPNGLERRTGMWREVLADPSNRSFVARDGGRIVGVLSIGPFRGEEAAGEVRVLYVLPEWWGSAAGRRLLERAHRELAREFDEAILTVLTANARARRFYERNGWRLSELLVEPHFAGRPTEVARYRRSLRTSGGGG